ncbi:DUF4132 domain-containing protein [Actinomadura rubrisoli]|uniref:DUF4132 domain-containing protein n=1 Tax=Actinomadura rubrisoli TaxID=2530368 RepID=A0A4R5CCA3_9ACTN|nr:DUF4132 domain-containing protein [Actinomadura rubrisoli]TDD94784.1 DUF4132 domain-containing protein [Actinomadura rubrisoli]
MAPDEDVLTLPDAWRAALHPRRGGTPGPEIKIGPSAVEAARKLVDRTGGAVESLLAAQAGDPELAEAARRHRDGTPDPAGAAAVAAVTATSIDSPGGPAVHRAFIDSWTAEHGIGFAACAAVELSRMAGQRVRGGGWNGLSLGVAYREGLGGAGQEPLRRVRSLLAQAGDRGHEEAAERLAAYRSAPATRWLVSYLVPTRRDWLEECLADGAGPDRGHRWLKLCAVDDAALLGNPPPRLSWNETSLGVLATMADAMGPDVLAVLLRTADSGRLDSRELKIVFETVAVLPTDEAFQALLERLDRKHARPALVAAMNRFPVRAVRLLAAAGSSEATALLREHLPVHAEVVAAALPGLPAEVRAAVEPIAASFVRLPEAPAEDVPGVLARPAWERPDLPVMAGLEPPAGRIFWADGRREEWLGADLTSLRAPEDPDWEALSARYRAGGTPREAAELMVHGPDDVVRPLLAGWKVAHWSGTRDWMRSLIARYGLDSYPAAMGAAKANTSHTRLLMPFAHADVALIMADWLRKSGWQGDIAREWFDWHGTGGVPLLVPAALGKAAARRRSAEIALRHVDATHGRAAVVDAARAVHGDEAADAIGLLLAAHPVETGLVRPPKIGDWADPAALPQVLLRGRERALPQAATRRLIELLALPDPYGLDEVWEACDPESLAEFGWALFQRWRDAGGPSKESWALAQLGRSGDDETVRRLTPVIRAWPGEGGHRYAVTGLGVLAGIGSDVALTHLHGIAQKVKFTGLKVEAQARIEKVADRLGLSTEQLADRLVPDFGLDADGTLTLDYGPRRFVVGFDEHLKPVVSDEDGKRRKALPSPGAKDDPELAPAAHKAFAALKKDVRTVASDQLHRLERTMVAQRRWTTDEFSGFIVHHPLVWHLARRLVWIADDGDTTSLFRIAEDRTLADADDDAFTLPGSARVGIAHPVTMGEAVETWSEVFADYEILQPFPQLGRAVHTLTDEERASGRLERFEKLNVPFGKVLGLVRLGWERGVPQGGGNEMWISRRVAGDRYVMIDLDPGIPAMEPGANGDHQVLERVWLGREPEEYAFRTAGEPPPRFGELDRVTASEILADLTGLADTAV